MVAERADDFDEQFFAMLGMLRESAEQAGQDQALLKLINLQALLYQKTEYGQRLEAQQIAMHKFNREAKQAGEVSPDLLLKHVLANRDDLGTVEALVSAATPALNYQFFVLMSERIDQQEQAGEDASELIALRERLLAIQEAITEQSRQLVEQATQTLQTILAAADTRQAIQENLSQIDDGFMYVLTASISQAEEQGDEEQAQALMGVYNAIREEMDSQMPPEVQLLNQIMSLESDAERGRMLDDNPQMVTPDFLELVMAVSEQAADSGRTELGEHLEGLQAMIAARLAT
jgi:hypothetical protein